MAKAFLRERTGDSKVAFNAHYGKQWEGTVLATAKSGKAVLIHFKGTHKDGEAYDFEKWIPTFWGKAVSFDNTVWYDLPWCQPLFDQYTKNNLK